MIPLAVTTEAAFTLISRPTASCVLWPQAMAAALCKGKTVRLGPCLRRPWTLRPLWVSGLSAHPSASLHCLPRWFSLLMPRWQGKREPSPSQTGYRRCAAATLRLVGQSSLHLEMFYCSKLKSLIILLQSWDPVEKTPPTLMTVAFSLKFPSNFRMSKQDPLFLNSAVLWNPVFLQKYFILFKVKRPEWLSVTWTGCFCRISSTFNT